jgi:hypothetical protein
MCCQSFRNGRSQWRVLLQGRSSIAYLHRSLDPDEHVWQALADPLHVFWNICALNLRRCWRKPRHSNHMEEQVLCAFGSHQFVEQETKRCDEGCYFFSETKKKAHPTCSWCQIFNPWSADRCSGAVFQIAVTRRVKDCSLNIPKG